MPPVEITGLNIFIFFLFLGVFSTVYGLPGTIVIFLDAFIYAAATGFGKIGFKILLLLFVLSAMAEAIDVGSQMAGAARFHFTRKSFLGSIAGSLAGVIVLTPILYGLGTLIGIFAGGFGVVVISELLYQSRLKQSLRTGYKAMLGKILALSAKGCLTLIMVMITLMTIYS